MDFQEIFTKKLANDLEQGVYANADDFAAGITKHYMSSLSLNAPNGIPLTMPSPLAAGTPVPVGPGNSITNKTRERIFYNTVRVYFVGKEISQGKLRIQSLSQDIQSAITTYNKLTSEIQDLQIQIQNLDDQLREIREKIQSIVPEFKKFINTKKEIIKSALDEVKTLGDRFRQLSAQNLSDFNFNEVMAQEIADLQSLLSLKVEPSLNIASIEETFQTLTSFARSSRNIVNKYKNTFTREANFKTYVSKKIRAVVNEFMKILNGFINPEKFIGYWKELIYVPGGRVIGNTMLQIIENNKKLKELKKKLLAKVEAKKISVRAQLDKKLDDLKNRLADTIKRVQSKIAKEKELNGRTKRKERLAAGRKVRETAKRVKAKAKKIRRAIRHYRLILDTIQTIFTKLFTIYTTIKQAIQQAIDTVADVKEKYGEIKSSIEESISAAAKEARQQALNAFKRNTTLLNADTSTAQLLESVGDSTPIVRQIMEQVQNLYKLNPPQVAAFLRRGGEKVMLVTKSVETILAVDIPRLKKLLSIKPNDPYYQQLMQEVDRITEDYNSVEGGAVGVASIVRGDVDRHMTYLRLIRSCRVINNKIDEAEVTVQRLISDKEEELIAVVQEQQYLDEYINTLLDTNPTAKRIRNKKRKNEFNIAKAKEKLNKFRKLAKEARLAYQLVVNAPRVFVGLVQNTDAPITQNEAGVRQLVNTFLELQLERGKITRDQKQADIKKFNAKVADLKAYEQIFLFFKRIIEECKETGLVAQIKKIYEEKVVAKGNAIQGAATGVFENLMEILDGARSKPTLQELAAIPGQLKAQGDLAYSIIRAEKAAFKRLRVKAAGLGSFIPQDTRDPGLLYLRYKLSKVSDLILPIIDGIGLFFKKIVELIEDLLDPVIAYIKGEAAKQKEKLEQDVAAYAKAKADSRINLDAKIMSFIFGLAGRLFWTGISWTNQYGTKFIVTNVGRFYPQMQALSENGAQGYAEELGEGFNRQLERMSGIAIPPLSTGIAPFTWRGYLSKQDYVIGY